MTVALAVSLSALAAWHWHSSEVARIEMRDKVDEAVRAELYRKLGVCWLDSALKRKHEALEAAREVLHSAETFVAENIQDSRNQILLSLAHDSVGELIVLNVESWRFIGERGLKMPLPDETKTALEEAVMHYDQSRSILRGVDAEQVSGQRDVVRERVYGNAVGRAKALHYLYREREALEAIDAAIQSSKEGRERKTAEVLRASIRLSAKDEGGAK
jgi:hypothetical protein